MEVEGTKWWPDLHQCEKLFADCEGLTLGLVDGLADEGELGKLFGDCEGLTLGLVDGLGDGEELGDVDGDCDGLTLEDRCALRPLPPLTSGE